MNTLLLVAAVLAAVPVGQAAHRREVSKRFVSEGMKLESLPGLLNLGASSSFREVEQAMTAKGHARQKLRQTYGGLEVVGAAAEVEVTAAGFFAGAVDGIVAYNVEQDIVDTTDCLRENQELLTKAETYLQENFQLTIGDVGVENLKVQRKIHFDGDQGVAKLVYEVQFFVDLAPTPCRPFFLLDACDPDLGVIIYFDKIHNMTLSAQHRRQASEECDTTQRPATTASPNPTGSCPSSAPGQGVGGNPKTGRLVYGQDQPYCLLTQVAGGSCTMTSKYARVIDLENGRSDSGKSPVEFVCSQGYSDPVNGAYGVANDAFYYGHSTGKLYEDWYGFYALGYAPKLRVHYSTCYENAFWNGRDMTFGDGCNSLYPLVSQDVIAHELGHGITDRYSDLYYSGQSGGINEAFSDMSGEVAELFSTGRNDWKVGYELFKADRALRYFEKPSDDGRSIDSADDYYDGIDVHYSSGVFNRAFWQLVNVQNLPLRQAYEVFLQANKVVWTETSNYQVGACGAMKAAYDLGYDVNKIKNAFAVVAIDLSSCNYQGFQQTVRSGETRQGVMVSTLRNPVFALEETPGSTVVIDAVSGNNAMVTVSVTSDAAGADVILSGESPFIVDITEQTAYFKVSSSSDDDMIIDVTVETV